MPFFILLLYTFAVLIRPQDWFSAMQGFPIVLLLAGISTMLCFMGVSIKKLNVPRVPENYFMLGLFIATLMSQVANTYLQGFMDTFGEFLRVTTFFFLTLIIVDSVNKVKVLSWLFIFSAVFMAVNGIFQFYMGVGLPYSTPYVEYGVKRIIGFGIFGDPNDLCLLFILVLPLTLAFIFEKRGFFQSLFASVSFLVIIWGVWLTNSRGGWLAFVVSILVFLRNRFKGMRWIIIVSLCLIVAAVFLPSRLTGKFLDSSSRERIIFWGFGNWAFKAHPIFGVGYNMLWQYTGAKAAHNSFIQCYGELGFFGYFFWVGLFYSVLLGLSRLNRYTRSLASLYKKDIFLLCEALMASLVGYLFLGLFVSRTYIVPIYIYLALAVRARCLASGSKILTGNVLSRAQTQRVLLVTTASIIFLYHITRFLVARI